MRIFVFEFITSGGWPSRGAYAPPSDSLLREGRAMVAAVVSDLAAIDGVVVSTLVDARLRNGMHLGCETIVEGADERAGSFDRLAEQADFTLLIAPEIDGHLYKVASAIVRSGGDLLSPSPEFIRLASDKQVTSQRLYERAIPTPVGISLSAGQSPPPEFTYPAVWKPCDGAGSLDVCYVADSNATRKAVPLAKPARLETYHAGIPASVSALCGPNGPVLLPPCTQSIADDGQFTYHGGSCPLPAPLAIRAIQLAEKALNAFPSTVGYVGVDLVLGEEASGAGDVVIEVNPRLTSSYIGLRSILQENLADAMLRVARGEQVELSTKPGRVEFSAGGKVQHHTE